MGAVSALFFGSCCPYLEGHYSGEIIFYQCKMTLFIEGCSSSVWLVIYSWTSISFYSSKTACISSLPPLLNRNFPLSPAKQRKSYLFTDPTETEMIKECPRKLWYNAYVVNSACQKVFKQLISLQKKQNVMFAHKLVDSPYLANFVFLQGFPSEYLNWVFLYFGYITSL